MTRASLKRTTLEPTSVKLSGLKCGSIRPTNVRRAAKRTRTTPATVLGAVLKVVLGIVVIAPVIAVSGCGTVGQQTQAPIELPASFSTTGSDSLPGRWWESFEDPALDALVREALTGNFGLKTAWDRLTQAQAIARREGANLVPSLDLESSALRNEQRTIIGTATFSNIAIGVSTSYELDVWGRIRSSRDAARFDAEASAADVAAAAITLASNVASTWYELAETLEQQRVLTHQIELNEQVLELVTLRFRQGQAEAADVFRQRQLLESTRGQLVLQRVRGETIEHRLAVLVGRTPTDRVDSGDAILRTLAPLPATGVPVALVQARPDVRAAYLGVAAADRRVAAAIKDRLPRISIGASVDTSGANAGDLFDNWFTSIAANLLAPVIDGGQRRAEVDRTRAVRAEAFHRWGDTILVSMREVEDALVSERRQAEFIASLTKQLETAQHVIDRTRDSYMRGQLDYLRVLDALTSRQALERQHITARRERIGFRIDLARALATGWEMERPTEPGHSAPADRPTHLVPSGDNPTL